MHYRHLREIVIALGNPPLTTVLKSETELTRMVIGSASYVLDHFPSIRTHESDFLTQMIENLRAGDNGYRISDRQHQWLLFLLTQKYARLEK